MITILDSNKKTEGKTCVALGNFDGVHCGHRRIIMTTIERAKEHCLRSCVYTFRDHTSGVLGISKKLLTEIDEKIEILSSTGCDIAYLDDFASIRALSPSEFCNNILKEKLNAEFVFCGENYRFGYEGRGDISILSSELAELGIKLEVVPSLFNEDNEIISSTMIRDLISCGKVKEACSLMNVPYRISGTVMHGKQLGRKLGFPTLNIPIPENKVVPKYGVYVTTCLLDGIWYKGISNIGKRPTTDSNTNMKDIVNCETYLFNYEGDAYGKKITVMFWDMLRPEMRFSSIDQLKAQIMTDTTLAKSCFKEIRPEFM